jgi:hypothetical protein
MRSMKNSITLEVVAPILDMQGLCVSCQAMMGQVGVMPAGDAPGDYPEDVRRDFQTTLALVQQASEVLGDGPRIRWSDPRSLRGLYLSLRHGIRRYPTFLLNSGEKIVGLEKATSILLPSLSESVEKVHWRLK